MMEIHEERKSSLQDAEEPLNFANCKSSLSELSLPVQCPSPSSMEFSSLSAVSLCEGRATTAYFHLAKKTETRQIDDKTRAP